MKIEVFAHNGIVGIKGEEVTPKGMGCVEEVNPENMTISQEAYDHLLKVKGSGDDMGEVDCFKAGDKTIFGWLGGPWAMINPEETTTSNDYDFTLLEPMIGEVETPADFKEAVDEMMAEDSEEEG